MVTYVDFQLRHNLCIQTWPTFIVDSDDGLKLEDKWRFEPPEASNHYLTCRNCSNSISHWEEEGCEWRRCVCLHSHTVYVRTSHYYPLHLWCWCWCSLAHLFSIITLAIMHIAADCPLQTQDSSPRNPFVLIEMAKEWSMSHIMINAPSISLTHTHMHIHTYIHTNLYTHTYTLHLQMSIAVTKETGK